MVMIYATVTCFTSFPIKAWCAAAVESVHSVCAGSVVLTGMTLTVIDICVRREDWKRKKYNRWCYIWRSPQYKQEQQQVCIPRSNSQLLNFSFFLLMFCVFFVWIYLFRPLFSGTCYLKTKDDVILDGARNINRNNFKFLYCERILKCQISLLFLFFLNALCSFSDYIYSYPFFWGVLC